MDPAVSQQICRVALQLFNGGDIDDTTATDTLSSPEGEGNEPQCQLQVQLLSQCINTVLSNTDTAKNAALVVTLQNLQRTLQSLDKNDAALCRKSFKTIDQQAAESFKTSISFKDKLYSTQVSVLSALYLNNYFGGDARLPEERTQLQAHVSELFAQLVDTSEVKCAIAEEFETRGVTTSIWLRLNQQTHTTEGQETLKAIADLQVTLESLFYRYNLTDHNHSHSFDVRNSRGAIVSLRLQRLSGHSAPITALITTDTHLFSGSSDKSILVWDLATHALLNRLEGGHEGGVKALVVAPGADMLYSACEGGTIASWDLCVMCQTASVHVHKPDTASSCPSSTTRCFTSSSFAPDSCPITALALSGTRLFSADEKGLLKAWDACMIGTPRLSELQWPSRQAHMHTITALAATDTRLFSAGVHVKVWDSLTLTLLTKIKMHSGLTTALCLHGDRLFTGSRAIKVWEDAASLQSNSSPSPSRRMKKHSHPVTAIVVSPDGRRLYSAAHVIKEWDLSSPTQEGVGDDRSDAMNVLREHASSVSCLAIAHLNDDVHMLYSGSLEGNDIFCRAVE